MVYSTVPSWHCQRNLASERPPLAYSSHVLTPHNASLDDPEAGLGLHQLRGRSQQWLVWKLKSWTQYLISGNN